ncbi:hypothetical protein BJY16_001772 [Actinoplanes octamycinicus]|uniref:Uncharacterized protein n=1 Tax=Actinoplanes octamycinicus TaxID=135948 RepID=A0A7W7GU22_9ACTN|nr:hypothetical protein [Actinoplanes octamycinicus]MBB4738313.1 hypothetical protein [Actinoplanes octamycinicus]GIE57430.1 hypothetical protein Aoc01nite_28320 [Actinoplanes octamycinicus]
MLVEIEKMRRFGWSPFPIVQVQTPVGRTAVPWCGAPDVVLGQYHVEWTIDTELSWGVNAKPAADPGPAIFAGGHCVVLRGRLGLTPDGAGVLDLDGSMILLDFVDTPPAEADASWVQIYVPHPDIQLHPFEL